MLLFGSVATTVIRYLPGGCLSGIVNWNRLVNLGGMSFTSVIVMINVAVHHRKYNKQLDSAAAQRNSLSRVPALFQH